MYKFLLDAAASADATAQGPSSLIMIAIFAVFIIFWYVIALRPQRKKEKELKEKVDKMRVGDEVITIGGLVGKVANIRDDEVTIMTSAANTLVTFKKSAVNNVVSRDAKKNEEDKKTSDKDDKSSDKTDKVSLRNPRKKEEAAESASSESAAAEDSSSSEE